MNLSSLGEKGLIERLRQRMAKAGSRAGLVVDIGDDTAAFRVPGSDKLTLFTCDMMVEDQHFRRSWPGMTGEKLGWKALATNVSDIASMGGRPTFALVSIALPGDTPVDFIDQVYTGLLACADEYGVILAGGDTVGSPHGIVIDVSLLGEVAPERILRRSGAKPGDLIAVTGPLGAAAAGLQLLESGFVATARGRREGGPPSLAAGEPPATTPPSRRRYELQMREVLVTALLEPKPKLREGQALAATGLVTAMMDLSDGLGEDLPRLCQESGVGATISLDALPVSEVRRALGLDALQLALRGGEDYQLLFTFAPDNHAAITTALIDAGCPPPVIIGEATAPDQGIRLASAAGTTTDLPKGFQHFLG